MRRTAFYIVLFVVMLPAFCMGKKLSNETLHQLMDLSGLQLQINTAPEVIHSTVEQNLLQKGQCAANIAEARSSIASIIDDNFNVDDATGRIAKEIQKNLFEEEAQQLLPWYTSQLGRTITQAENEASSDEAVQIIMQNGATLLRDKARFQAAVHIDELLELTKRTVEIIEDTNVKTLNSMNLDAKTLALVKKEMQQQAPGLKAAMQQYVIASQIYTYKDIELEQLKQYISFLERPETQTFVNSGADGLQKVISDNAANIIPKIVASLADICGNPAVIKASQSKSDKNAISIQTPADFPKAPAEYARTEPVTHVKDDELKLSNVTIQGAAYGVSISGNGEAWLQNCHIVGGISGIDISGNVSVSISNCTIYGAQQAIRVSDNAEVSLKDCLIQGKTDSLYLEKNSELSAENTSIKGSINTFDSADFKIIR